MNSVHLRNHHPTSQHPQHSQSLDEVGIRRSTDRQGNQQLSIEVDVDGNDGTKTCQAVFYIPAGRWKLVKSNAVSHGAGTSRHPPRDSTSTGNEKCWIDFLPMNDNVEWFWTSADWANTDFGPLESWPVSLRTIVGFLLSDVSPACIYWGPSFSACFNLTAHNDLRQRLSNGTTIQGKPFKEIWQESWPTIEDLFHTMQLTNSALETPDIALYPQEADGCIEESIWSGTFLPIFNEGMDRRSKTLHAVSTPAADPQASVWEHLFQALGRNPHDFPMAFAYSAEDEGASCTLTLEQSLGLPPSGHPLVPKVVDIFEGAHGFPFYYRKLKATHKPVILRQFDKTLPEGFLEGFEWREGKGPPTGIAICPVSVSSRLLGVLVFGLTHSRRFQEEDDAFINSLCRQVSATIALAVDRVETHDRAERLTLQLQESERQVREIAEHGPAGMIRVSAAGKIMWANRQYFEITGHPISDHYDFSFLDPVHPDDKAGGIGIWQKLVNDVEPVSQEIRVNRTWTPPATVDDPHPDKESCWIMVNAFPALENGEVKSIICCLTDISRHKWAEKLQSRVAVEATEARKLQEAFIDIVSHEIRNPLSAITQLGDGIATSFDDWVASDRSMDTASRLLEESADYGKTILLCAAHQKRLVDDVLTLSKLDSQLLAITPVVVQPHAIVESVLTMFQAEFATHSIGIENIADENFLKHNLDYVLVDPARLTQIFINLLTNAIKFTIHQPVRKITIHRSVFIGHVPQIDHIVWFSANQRRPAPVPSQEDNGDAVNLLFSVSDTGKGLEQEEMARLFHRFQQGTKKTHIKYGGSGLGLFISRELTEAMDGQIEVVTHPGKGSTFAFYVKAHKVAAPKDPAQISEAPISPPLPLPSPASDFNTAFPIRVASTVIPKGSGVRLLLVEDNLVNAQVLTKQLERAGVTTYNANHGAEALDFLERTKLWHDYKPVREVEVEIPTAKQHDISIDCILMDVEMPVLDGLSCTRRIREWHQRGLLTQHVQIIAITANARAEQIQAAFDAGVDDVLPKPFRVTELLAKIEKITEKREESVSEG
ncbi:hypothetical protein H2200_007942 [Cladophialophora chaetospira]|uniref:histidine kinase n=1 Tax=Cladophialophora chaetospira TaxID=386627 RepID=A0AA38X6U8_9EURO|nr:hypothetical protein H2200_007942 [Cladophialophora chaetospira]